MIDQTFYVNQSLQVMNLLQLKFKPESKLNFFSIISYPSKNVNDDPRNHKVQSFFSIKVAINECYILYSERVVMNMCPRYNRRSGQYERSLSSILMWNLYVYVCTYNRPVKNL